MSRRAAIYARFSSDKQNEKSCEDQADLCAAWIERQGWTVVKTYLDSAVSGASTVNRIGLGRLMRDARAGQFDVVVAEALDRLSRDQADLAKIRKDLNFLEIGISTVQDGEVGAMHIGLKGLMGELYLADLAQKTRRGQSARVREGASGGGRSYGYDPVPGRPGELAINAREAAIVRRIFAEYVAGRTPRQIVSALNADGVPSPRGGKWNSSTVNGSAQRRNGLIVNRLYAGEIVWNRQRFIKDPATAKRISRLNPESEWIVSPAPHLAIVDPETFAAATASKLGKGFRKPYASRKPKHLLSGLLKCGCCGASYTIIGRDRLGCAGFRERGDCANGRTVERRHIEGRVLIALQARLAEPELIAEYVRTYREERTRLAATERRERAVLQRRLADITMSIERIVDRVVDGSASDALVARLGGMEAEQKSLRAELARIEAAETPIALHPTAPAQYARLVKSLRDGPGDDEAVIERVRGLIERIVVTPPADSQEPVDLAVHGLLADLLLFSRGEPSIQGNAGCGDRI